MKSLNELAADIHANAVAHGWWQPDYPDPDKPVEPSERNPFEVLALIHSEVTEALEELRRGFDPDDLYFEVPGKGLGISKQYIPGSKPAGVPSEMADVIIRVLDACAAWSIDIDHAMALKMEYNLNRPYRHGGKRA